MSILLVVLALLAQMLTPRHIDYKVLRTGEGLVSWYNTGTKTASGERFSPEAFTAASPHLPFGTKVRVTNRRTGKFAYVRVNDRGPYEGGREMDLSQAAARRIELAGV